MRIWNATCRKVLGPTAGSQFGIAAALPTARHWEECVPKDSSLRSERQFCLIAGVDASTSLFLGLPASLWQSLGLTIELAACTTLLLIVVNLLQRRAQAR